MPIVGTTRTDNIGKLVKRMVYTPPSRWNEFEQSMRQLWELCGSPVDFGGDAARSAYYDFQAVLLRVQGMSCSSGA
jgi:hypothetical protein